MLKFLSFIDESYNIFDKNPEINEYLEIVFIFVDSNFRGFGIANNLIEKSLEYQKNKKLPMVKVFCTSIYSSRIMEKLNFTNVFCSRRTAIF